MALKTRVHGPREGGVTFLAQFATKYGKNTQLLTNTIGPIELWAFSTTAEDSAVRNKLYHHIGPKQARQLLSRLYPGGTIRPVIEQRMAALQEEEGFIGGESASMSLVDQLVEELLAQHSKDVDAGVA